MKLEFEITGDAEHAFGRVVEESERPDGTTPEPDELAEQVVRQFAAEQYQEIVMNGE